MNEQILINMLSELDAGSLKENFTDKDLRNKDGNLFKRAYFYIKSLSKAENAEQDTILLNHLEEYQDNISEFVEVSVTGVQENKPKEENISQWNFSIHVFKRGLHTAVKLVTAVAAAILVIIGLILVILKRKQVIKKGLEKIQISY